MVALGGVYTAIFILSLLFAYLLRFDFSLESNWRPSFYQSLIWIVPLKIVFLLTFGQFKGFLRYFRLPDLYRLLLILGLTSIIIIVIWYMTEGKDSPPRSVILGDFIFSLLLICGFRISLRIIRERQFYYNDQQTTGIIRNVAVIGAGDTGAAIASDLLAKPRLGIRPVVFLDDNSTKWQKDIHGILVAGSPEKLQEIKSRFKIKSIIIAIPSVHRKRISEIIQKAGELQLSAEIAPSLKEWANDKIRLSRLRPVEVEDLLERDLVRLDSQSIHEMITDKVVMVTGAGGSIGSELCYQVIAGNPRLLILVEHSEHALFCVEQKLRELYTDKNVLFLIADILDSARMESIFKKFAPNLIFHAAAYKHVRLMEYQASEAIKNNVLGTKAIADLASKYNTKRFVLISTDKAINPTGLMGASKRLAEIYIQAKQNAPDNKTCFSAVRFGNVFGSSGSVVRIFKEQIAQGKTLKVTHPEATRYFMTVSEAVGLVLQSATQEKNGEIFLLDMGQSIKIVELAYQMIKLSGLRPDIDIKVEFTGLHPGEKLHEEISYKNEKLASTTHPQVMRLICEPRSVDTMTEWILALTKELDTASNNALKQKLQSFIPEYKPYLDEENGN